MFFFSLTYNQLIWLILNWILENGKLNGPKNGPLVEKHCHVEAFKEIVKAVLTSNFMSSKGEFYIISTYADVLYGRLTKLCC